MKLCRAVLEDIGLSKAWLPLVIFISLFIFGCTFLAACILAKRKRGVMIIPSGDEYDPRSELKVALGLD